MTQESKKLLLQDLCSRLPYGVICYNGDTESNFKLCDVADIDSGYPTFDYGYGQLEGIKPYLRPMEDMTEEEVREFYAVENITPQVGYIHPTGDWHFTIYGIDWLLENHFDYRGLIEKDLAIKVTDKNNPYKS